MVVIVKALQKTIKNFIHDTHYAHMQAVINAYIHECKELIVLSVMLTHYQ